MKSFKSPRETKISGRSSTIRGAFINSIVPNLAPSAKELDQVYKMLNLDDHDLRCVYCRDKATEWDHFRPTVSEKNPTGFLAEIYNLVPSCGKCNQSKGGRHWEEWINSDAKLSPKFKVSKPQLRSIIQTLRKYEKWSDKKVNRVDYKKFDTATLKLLKEHWNNCEEILKKWQRHRH